MCRISPSIGFEMNPTNDLLTAAVADGKLLDSAKNNILSLLSGTTSEIAPKAVEELVNAGAWDELNDRFFKPSLSARAVCADARSVAW